MNSASVAFLLPVLPHRNRNQLSRKAPCMCAAASEEQDQWEQFESGSKEARLRQLQALRDVTNRERDHQIFISNSSKPMLIAASNRFMDGIRRRYLQSDDQSEMAEKRLWIVESIADDTFGTLRGEPYPPRVCVMESIDSLTEDEGAQRERDTAVSRWTGALNRTGKALSTLQNYSVDYAVWGGASSFGNFHELQPGYLVASEVLNASWSRPEATEDMRQLLLSYAQESVNNGKVAMYQVLQSVEEPTMFKTVEAYACMDDLRGHMETMDAEFAENAKKHRAAVNRVRQLCRCVDTLHSFAPENAR